MKPANCDRHPARTSIRIIEESAATLRQYGEVSIAFEVTSRLEVGSAPDCSAAEWVEVEVVAPYVKDYDALPGNGPASWPARWDLSNWGVLAALQEERRVGGAVLAWNTSGVELLQGRADLAVLWDLRIVPEFRGQGIGGQLFARAVEWAQQRGCRQLLVETQDINVAACRFYAKQGCRLGEVHPFAYPGLPDEVQLLWYLDLPG